MYFCIRFPPNGTRAKSSEPWHKPVETAERNKENIETNEKKEIACVGPNINVYEVGHEDESIKVKLKIRDWEFSIFNFQFSIQAILTMKSLILAQDER